MKDKKRYLLYLSFFMVLFTLTGCQKTNQVGPNKSSSKDLMSAIKKEIPVQAQLYVPEESKEKQSVYQVDLDQDQTKEAIVLYQNKADNMQIHILILKKESTQWVKLSDTAFSAYVLDYFDVISLDDNEKELVVGEAQTKEDATKQLELYHLEKNSLQLDQTLEYQQVLFDTFIKNQNNPACILFDGTIGVKQTAYLYDFEGRSLVLKSQIDLDSYAQHEHLVSGNLSDGTKAVFMDSGVGAHSMLTEVVFSVDGTLKLLGGTSDANYLKDAPLYSKEIDSDGVIEIARTILPLAYEDAASAEIPTIAEYASIDQNGNKTVKKVYYINEGENFEIEVPKDLEKKLIVESAQNSISIKNQETNQILYQINWTKENEIPKNKVLVQKSMDMLFYHDQKEYAISDDAFHLLEENFN